jgi:hypothetical protein
MAFSTSMVGGLGSTWCYPIVRNLLHVDSGHVPDRTEFNNLKSEGAIKQIEATKLARSSPLTFFFKASDHSCGALSAR